MVDKLNYESKYILFLTSFILFVFTMILHSTNLWIEPFWYDEIVSVKATLLDFGHVKHMAEWDNNPPFYYYCLWIWEKIAGISEYNIRFLNVIIQSFSVGLIFWFVKKYFNYLSGVFASLFYSLHNFSFEYSQEARCYPLVVLLIIISTILFFRLVNKPSLITSLLLGLVNFLILYTHYIAGIFLFFQFIYLFVFHFNSKKGYIISIIVTILFVALRFTKKQLLLIFSFNSEGKTFWLQKADEGLFFNTIKQLFSGESIWIFLLIFYFSAIAFVFISKNTFSKQQKQITIYFILISSVSIIFLFLLGKITPIFLGRYLLFVVPFIGITISMFLLGNKKLITVLSLITLAMMAINLNVHPTKNMDYRLATLVVKSLNTTEAASIIIQTKCY